MMTVAVTWAIGPDSKAQSTRQIITVIDRENISLLLLLVVVVL